MNNKDIIRNICSHVEWCQDMGASVAWCQELHERCECQCQWNETENKDSNLLTVDMKVECLLCGKEWNLFDRKRNKNPYICSDCIYAFSRLKKIIDL